MDEWNYTQIDDFYNRVRAVLNTYSTASLTYEQIDMPEKAPTADRFIKSIVVNWKEYKENDADKFAIFESCIVYQTAIYFYRYIKERQIKSRSTPELKVEYSTSGNIKDDIGKPLEEILADLLGQLNVELPNVKKYYGFMVT